jgi:acyl carrier protein
VTEKVGRELRGILAEVWGLRRDVVDDLPADTPLFDGPFPLTSLAGARLLASIHERLLVDVAAEDLGLDSLESIATLTAFVGAHATDAAGEPKDDAVG